MPSASRAASAPNLRSCSPVTSRTGTPAKAPRRSHNGSCAPVPVRHAAYHSAEPVGCDQLAGLAADLYAGGDAPWAASPRPEPMRVERSGEEFVLVLDLPLTRPSEVDLERRGDELWLLVGGHRRVIALPSALRRCVVVGAAVREGSLRVRFEPDPDLWRPL